MSRERLPVQEVQHRWFPVFTGRSLFALLPLYEKEGVSFLRKQAIRLSARVWRETSGVRRMTL